MFNISFHIVFLSAVEIFLMGAVGYWLIKAKILPREGLKFLNYLFLHIFLPCFIFSAFIEKFSFDQYPNWWIFPLIGMIMTFAAMAVGKIVLLGVKNIQNKNEFLALSSFQNSGYIPLVMASTILPAAQAQEVHVYIFLFLIGFNLLIWSFGVWLITKGKGQGFNPRNLLNPPLVATAVALLVVFLGVDRFLPDVIMNPVQGFGACALPISIIFVGGNLALIDITEKKYLKEIVVVVLTKLILFPAIVLFVVYLLKIKSLVGLLIVLEATVPSALTLVALSHYYKSKEHYISQAIFYGYLVSIVTVPIFLTLYQILIKAY